MQVLEIKTRLHKKIDMIQNKELLLEALHLLDLETETEEIMLPKEISDKILTAKLEKENGYFLEHSEANEIVTMWLNKVKSLK